MAAPVPLCGDFDGDWVLRFDADGPEGSIDRKNAPGATPKLDTAHRRALKEMVEHGPILAGHGVVRWRLKDLAQWLFEEFGVSMGETTVGRELRALGFRKIAARPRHRAQNVAELED